MATNKEIIKKAVSAKSARDPEMGDYIKLMKEIDPKRKTLEADFNKKNPPTGNEEKDYSNMRKAVDPKVKEITRSASVKSVSQGIPPRTSASATPSKALAERVKVPKTIPKLLATVTSPTRFGALGTTARSTPQRAPAPEKKEVKRSIIKDAIGAIKGGAGNFLDNLLAPKPMSKQQKKYIEEFEVGPRIQKQLDEKRKKESLNKFY